MSTRRDLTEDIVAPLTMQERMERGQLEYSAQQFHDAKITFANLAKDYPYVAQIWINLGNAEYRLRGYLLAEKSWKEGLALNPMEVDTYLNLGSLLIEQQRIYEGVYYWRLGLQLDEKNKALWVNLAELYKKQKRYLKTFQMYQRYLEIAGPRDVESQKINRKLTQGYNAYKPNIQIAQYALQQHNLDHARRAYDKALEYYIGTAQDYKMYAAALYKLKRFDDALEAYWGALDLNDSDPVIYTNLGIILDKKGETIDALWAYIKATRLSPENDALQEKLLPRINKMVASINTGNEFATYLAKGKKARETYDLEKAKTTLFRLQDMMPYTEPLRDEIEEEMTVITDMLNIKQRAQHEFYSRGEEALEKENDEEAMHFFGMFTKYFPDDPVTEELSGICEALADRIEERKAQEAEELAKLQGKRPKK